MPGLELTTGRVDAAASSSVSAHPPGDAVDLDPTYPPPWFQVEETYWQSAVAPGRTPIPVWWEVPVEYGDGSAAVVTGVRAELFMPEIDGIIVDATLYNGAGAVITTGTIMARSAVDRTVAAKTYPTPVAGVRKVRFTISWTQYAPGIRAVAVYAPVQAR